MGLWGHSCSDPHRYPAGNGYLTCPEGGVEILGKRCAEPLSFNELSPGFFCQPTTKERGVKRHARNILVFCSKPALPPQLQPFRKARALMAFLRTELTLLSFLGQTRQPPQSVLPCDCLSPMGTWLFIIHRDW